MWKEIIHIEGPYDFDRVLERHALDPLNQLDLGKRTIKIPLCIKKESFVVEVAGLGTVEQPVFQIESRGPKTFILERVKETFQWNVSLQEVNRHFQQTNVKKLFTNHYGTPLVLDFDPLYCLFKCIIHQQLNLTFAHTLTERFVKTYGFEKEGVWFYPCPEVVAKLTVEQLRELQFSGKKAEYVIGIAKLVVDGSLNIEELKQKTDEQIYHQLIKIRGVGAWTIQNFLLFGLGRPNLFPLADVGIQNAIKKLFNLEKKPTLEEMELYKQGWEPYLSYASLYLWRSIE
ncbi:MAG: DNA-3-methyladenine glycosylase [Bacillota bacterium]|nr:DNA-3-methyladenine glycosylase [Bacillota bacterium]